MQCCQQFYSSIPTCLCIFFPKIAAGPWLNWPMTESAKTGSKWDYVWVHAWYLLYAQYSLYIVMLESAKKKSCSNTFKVFSQFPNDASTWIWSTWRQFWPLINFAFLVGYVEFQIHFGTLIGRKCNFLTWEHVENSTKEMYRSCLVVGTERI